MGRRDRGVHRETKDNGRPTSMGKVGATVPSRQATPQESPFARSAKERPKVDAPGQDQLHQQIAELAFLLYERSGFQDGNDLEHWLEAERQVKGLRGQAA